jgi:UDP-glucose 4-epimerase
LGALRATLESLGSAIAPLQGLFFLASSAGGVYSGVNAPPYDEFSPMRPLSDYGRAKFEAEGLVTEWSQRSGVPTMIGRIANLYGPGQNISKPQGLITQICRCYLLGKPLAIYVSLDTLRDYFFAPDCAVLINNGLSRLRHESSKSGPLVVTKILASQHAITIGAVLGEMRRIFKSPAHVMIAASEASPTQARDLSLRSVVWPELDRRELTPFPVGVAITMADLRRKLQDANL